MTALAKLGAWNVDHCEGGLQFLANTDGSPTWFSEQIVAPGLTDSAPAMVRTLGGIDKAGTDIAVMTG